MFRSATFKLTLWYLAIVIVISLIFSAVIYHFAVGGVTSGLHHQTSRIFREFPVFNGQPSLVNPQDADVAAGSHRVLKELIEFNVLVFVLAGFASYFLARRTLEPIEVSHEQQKRFTADVSHELRTPLTSLKMGTEVALLDKQANKEHLREALTSNLEDAAKMEMLINNLLRLTKLDNDQAQAAFGPVNVAVVAESAISQVQKIADAKDVTLDNQAKATTVVGDQGALTQLLVILLDNAIKYSPPKSSVRLATAKHDATVSLVVHDNGQGIAKETLPHVFERFYREDKARTSTTTSGFGLGLSIAKLIADRHNATLTLASRAGHGTIATLTLPEQKQS